MSKYDYYNPNLTPYMVIRSYPHITDPAHQHALKKLMRLGQGHKELLTDLTEVIDSLQEYKEFLEKKTTKIK